MGLHWTYDQANRGPRPAPPAPREWVCEWIDLETGKTDRNFHTTQADAEREADGLRDLVQVIGVRRQR